ncbi:FecR domain-containing protein [Cupriavidus pauculus]|uniref:Transcriptional regulator n=1 Tax=Cupriavidus pauculus TaxID=82633 RepID=A0A2N5CDL3_9BURK|nr:FecR domain-containing protein [Cupriavidus pauculus]PLQ00306.1 transcriptional regulator [Cupriavidus pauculus]
MPSLRDDLPSEIVNEAIDWAVRLLFNEPTEETRRRFLRWESADPRHKLAWQRIQSLRDGFPKVPVPLALETLRTADAIRGRRRAGRRQALKVLALGGVSVLGLSTGYRYTPWQRWLAQISTSVGEQRKLLLDDGTVVVLNTDSAVDIRFDAERRDVILRRGEILVTTGHDDHFEQRAIHRPFRVRTSFGTMRALGTRFTVRLDDNFARVSVQEGAVALHAGNGDAASVASAGTTWTISQRASSQDADTTLSPDSWANGLLSGTNMRLADVLAELGRYRRGRIDCDPAIANLTISGAYRIDDTDRTLRFLEKVLPIRISYFSRYWIRVIPKG